MEMKTHLLLEVVQVKGKTNGSSMKRQSLGEVMKVSQSSPSKCKHFSYNQYPYYEDFPSTPSSSAY